MVKLFKTWAQQGGYGVISAQAGSELEESSSPADIRRLEMFSGLSGAEATQLVAGVGVQERTDAIKATILGTQQPRTLLPAGWGGGAAPVAYAGAEDGVDEDFAAGMEAYKAGLTTSPVTATPMALPLLAPVALVGGRALIMAIRAIAGRFLTVGVFKTLVQRFGPVAVKLAIGTLAFVGLETLVMGGASDEQGVGIPKRRKRYSIGSNPRVKTLAKVSGHCKRMLKRHEKVIKEFLPGKKTTYGIPPARALSAIEKAAIRG